MTEADLIAKADHLARMVIKLLRDDLKGDRPNVSHDELRRLVRWSNEWLEMYRLVPAIKAIKCQWIHNFSPNECEESADFRHAPSSVCFCKHHAEMMGESFQSQLEPIKP